MSRSFLAVNKYCPAPSPILLPPFQSNSGLFKFAGYGPCSLSPDMHLLLRPISSTHRTVASRFHRTASFPLRIFFITLPRRCGSLPLHRRGFLYTSHTHLFLSPKVSQSLPNHPQISPLPRQQSLPQPSPKHFCHSESTTTPTDYFRSALQEATRSRGSVSRFEKRHRCKFITTITRHSAPSLASLLSRPPFPSAFLRSLQSLNTYPHPVCPFVSSRSRRPSKKQKQTRSHIRHCKYMAPSPRRH